MYFFFNPIGLSAIVTIMALTAIPLQTCPSSPNCVSSQATDSHYIEAFPANGDMKAVFDRLKEILERHSDTSIIATDERTVQVEFRTTLGFIDDGLFVMDEQNRVIHIRSASRSGYWDFGKNRRRMEEIRQEYLQQ